MSEFFGRENKITRYSVMDGFRTCIQVPEGIVALKDGVFLEDGYHIEKIILPESLLSIGRACFSGCSRLKEIVLPEHLKSIGSSAFYNCKNLKKINIPRNLSFIDKMAFMNCTNLTAFEVDKDNPYFASDENGILYDKNFETIIAVPRKFYAEKKELILPEIKAVEKYAFDSCEHLEKIVIPESISEVPKNAFYHACCPIAWHGIEIPVFVMLDAVSQSTRRYTADAYMNCLFRLLSKKDFKLLRYYKDTFLVVQEIYAHDTELNETQLKSATEILLKLTEENERSIIEGFLDMKIFVTQENIDNLIRYAIEQQSYEIQLMLTEYKRKYIGYQDIQDIAESLKL